MAVDGKNASGRLAAATFLWLLVAIFANQDYVHCEGEQQQQELDQRLQQQQQQLQQQQQQQQFQPPGPQQQQLQPPGPQQQLPPPQQPIPQPQMSLSQPQRPPNQPQELQQQRPPNQSQELSQPLGILGPLSNKVNDMNPDFGSLPITQIQQSLSNVGAPSDMLGGGRIPSFPGGPSMVPVTQAGGPSQAPSFDGTNLSQGVNPQLPLNSPFESNSNPNPYPNPNSNPQLNQNQWRPPPRGNEQMNNAQGPMVNLQQKYPEQNLQQRPAMMSVPSHIQYPQNHYPGLTHGPPMGQQIHSQIPRPYQPQFYFNGNAENMYEIPVSTNPPAGYPGQSLSNMNFGDLMRPTQMFSNMMPENPLDMVQKPVGMIINSVDKLGKYGEGVKDGITNALREVVTKIFDQGQSGARRVFDMGLSGTNAAIDFGRRILIPDSRNPHVDDSGARYNSPQMGMQQMSMPPGYGFNSNQPPPTHMGYAMQPHAGQFAGGNGGNGQMHPPTQGNVLQNEYQQQRPGPNYGTNNPINAPQPIVRYGQG